MIELKNLFFIIFIATIAIDASAQIDTETARLNPDQFLIDESIVYDESAGIKEDITYTGNDNDRLAIQYHFNYELNKISDMQGYQVSYGRKVGESLWMEGIVQKVNGTFGSMAENQTPNPLNPDPRSEARNTRLDNESVSVLLFGIGVGYRFKFFTDFFETADVFETTNAYLTYNNFEDPYHKYGGWGMKADYGIHKRINSTFFIGGRLSYNWAQVETADSDVPGEQSLAPDRRLMLSWLNLAAEIGYYY